MLNQITVQGRLVADPELRMTQNQIAVTTFTLACNRDRNREETDFVSCVAWRGTAEFTSKFFRKGQLAIVTGRLQSRNWTDRDGNKRTAWEVQADNVYFGESKKNDGGEGYAAGEPQYTPPKVPEAVEDDGELPFD